MSIRPSPQPQEQTMTVSLVTFSKAGARKKFDIKEATTVIGRKIDADLRIPLGDISRSHCEIVTGDNGPTLRDLGSSNGTFLNGDRVTEHSLQAGDRIRLGPVVFVVQIDGEPSDITPESLVAAAKKASGEEVTQVVDVADSAGTDNFDVDELDDLDELDIEDLSDLDLELDSIDEDSEDLEEIDDLEELDEDDLIEDDD